MQAKWINHPFITTSCLVLLIVILNAGQSFADDLDLAEASQNPVANMISLPMKNKFNFGRGPDNASSYVLELQPVLPVTLGKVNLINRFIIPLAYEEGIYDNMDSSTGLKDTTYQAFFSPAEPGKFIWGLGPTMILPTHTDDNLGQDKWAAGPAGLLLIQKESANFGLLGQHFWDFAGDDDASEINLSTLQYFINYNTPHYYINTSPTMSYNWEADSGNEWTVPVGLGIGKIFRFGDMPVDMRLSTYWNVEKPEGAADWFAEFQIKFLFPK